MQFDDEEDEELAAAVALPWWRRWHWLLALVLPLALSVLILAAGITVRILYPQPVRSTLTLGPNMNTNPCRGTAGGRSQHRVHASQTSSRHRWRRPRIAMLWILGRGAKAHSLTNSRNLRKARLVQSRAHAEENRVSGRST